jgi:Conserved carboxylase domain
VTVAAPAITGRPADLLGPELAKAVAEVRGLVPAADDAEALSYALFPAVYRSYRSAVDRGLTPEVLTAAALGVIGALRTPTPPRGSAAAASSGGGVSPWAHEGRARLHAQRRWVDASTRRSGR